MQSISVVILTKNEAHNIVRCITPLLSVSDDIILLDNGSTDGTQQLAIDIGAVVKNVSWQGYAATKNEGNKFAKHDWILSLDADEVVNDDLIVDIKQLFSNDVSIQKAFSMQRKFVYENKILHHGSVGNEYRIRLFNRKVAHWNQADVHEDIEFSDNVTIEKLRGYALHYSYKDTEDHFNKLVKYAQLSANQLYLKGKKSSILKLYFSPIFGFIKNFIFRLGFLDGEIGLKYALHEMNYTRLKYGLLASMWKK